MLPGANPVSRGVDRVEGCSLVLAVLLGALLVPIMLAVGSRTYANVVDNAEQQARTRHQVVAILVEDAPRADPGGGSQPRVPARWRTAYGTDTGRVLAETGLRAGDRVRIWLDEDGDPSGPPARPADAATAAALVTITGWLIAVALLGMVHSGIKHLLDRRRYRDWGREWARVEPRWRAGPPGPDAAPEGLR